MSSADLSSPASPAADEQVLLARLRRGEDAASAELDQ